MAHRRDGRRRYDDDSKQALVRACLQPGISLAGMALKHGADASLLRKWVVSYQLAAGAPTMPAANRMDAFIPVMLGDGGAGRNAQGKPVPVQLGLPTKPSCDCPAGGLFRAVFRLRVDDPSFPL
ncbi:transposase [Herminiimonas sp. CN]|uniref:transposase n=1 Tax=Herminiimonas sp. CN TaxID=1349818 RepID=UPI0009DDE9AF|nr:transposase [Herminiimonas sp. CN]